MDFDSFSKLFDLAFLREFLPLTLKGVTGLVKFRDHGFECHRLLIGIHQCVEGLLCLRGTHVELRLALAVIS